MGNVVACCLEGQYLPDGLNDLFLHCRDSMMLLSMNGPVCGFMLEVGIGLKGTYQGLTATILKQGSNQAIRFFVMTSLKNWYKGMEEQRLSETRSVTTAQAESYWNSSVLSQSAIFLPPTFPEFCNADKPHTD
eukprot:g30705.t1